MDLIIRRAVAADADAVSDLYLRARRAAAETGSIPPAAHADDEVAGWIARVVIAKLDCWLAQTPGARTVGILVLRGDWIDQLYVDPVLATRHRSNDFSIGLGPAANPTPLLDRGDTLGQRHCFPFREQAHLARLSGWDAAPA
jgi:hypothetical protein